MKKKYTIAQGLLSATIILYTAGVTEQAHTMEFKRIVSLNLCTDQLVINIAQRHNIAALSFLVIDPKTSASVKQAKGIPLVRGSVEEIINLKPDIVFSGVQVNPVQIKLLKRFKLKIIQVPIATSLKSIEDNIQIVANALNLRRRGTKIIQEFRQAIKKYSKRTTLLDKPIAALLWPNGLSSGRGTLPHSVIEKAGFRNLSALINKSGTSFLSIEALLRRNLDLLVLGQSLPNPSLAHKFLDHPALSAKFSRTKKILIPDNLWLCGTPNTATAVRILSSFHGENLNEK